MIGDTCCANTQTSALSALMLVVRRHRRQKQQQEEEEEEEKKEAAAMETASQKVLRYGADGGPRRPAVPLRRHPRRRERRLRREDVRASIRMSLGESHLIGPDDEVFGRFILDRLAEADRDPGAAPPDCLRSFAYEGSGSPAGSLSSLESASLELEPGGPVCNPRPPPVRLTPWYGGGEEDTFF